MHYDLSEELANEDEHEHDGPIGYECVLEDYPDHVLCPPYEKLSVVRRQLPTVALFTAGKLRIWHGGDLFWTKQVSHRLGTLEQRNCYVKTCTGSVLVHTGYGDLEKIIALAMPAIPFFRALGGKTVIVAFVRPWDTNGKLASEENVFFKFQRVRIIMDIRSLKAVDITAGAGEHVHDELDDNDDFIL
ncbi:hypothetical protein V8B97DRAFT_2023570 [Scleroderma yunnanense]